MPGRIILWIVTAPLVVIVFESFELQMLLYLFFQ